MEKAIEIIENKLDKESYYERNREIILDKRKTYLKENRDKINSRRKELRDKKKETETIIKKNKIYKIVYNSDVIYIGRTKSTLRQRFNSDHPSIPKEIKNECIIELLEETEDISRENYFIELFIKLGDLYNIRNGDTGLTKKDYNKEWQKRDYHTNKEITKEKRNEYNRKLYDMNKDERNKRRRELYKLKKDEKTINQDNKH